MLPLFGCVPSLCPSFVPFLLCLWYIAFEYGFISRFKGVFGAFWGADVCLYRLRSLRGLWGFCVREWLGGYMACGVFRLSFSSLFLSCPAFVLLLSCFPAWLLLLVLSCFLGFVGLAVGFLSLTDYTQKERALRVGASSLVLLWVVGLLCKIWLPVLVKFVIVGLDYFSYTFVRVGIFVIIPPLLEKTFKHTPDKFPRV